jgi:hypothetical protein
VLIDSNGERLTSVFQYANTYAAFLIAVMLIALWKLTTAKKWSLILMHGMLVVPIMVSFFLTLSRGGLVALPMIGIVFLLLLPMHQQIRLILYGLIGGLSSLSILAFISSRGISLQQAYTAGGAF